MSKVHPVYGTKAAAETAANAFPGTPLTVLEFYDRKVDRAEETISGTVPTGAPYQLRFPRRVPGTVFSITVNSAARTLIAGDSPASGQVAFDDITGVFTFHSSDDAQPCALTLFALDSVIDAGFLHWLQQHVRIIERVLSGAQPMAVEFAGALRAKSIALDSIEVALSAATDDIDHDGSGWVQLSPAASYTLTSTPTITAGTDGQELTIGGSVNSDSVTLQDGGTLSASKLRLGATTRVIGVYSRLRLQWDDSEEEWVELSYAENAP